MSSLNPPPQQLPDFEDPQQRVFFEQSKDALRLIFERMINPNGFTIVTRTPASASDFGKKGMIATDTNYVYVCTADNTWKRVSISTW